MLNGFLHLPFELRFLFLKLTIDLVLRSKNSLYDASRSMNSKIGKEKQTFTAT